MDRELDIGTRRTRLWRRTGLTLGTVMAAIGLFLLSTAWLRPSVSRADIRFGRVKRGDLEATMQASGKVVPAAERVLSSPVEARVVRILKEPGALLKPGDAILELDASATRLEVDRLEEKLAQNRTESRQRDSEFEKMRADLEHQVEMQKLDLDIARYRMEQSRLLRAQDLISENTLKEAEVNFAKAAIRLEQLEDEIRATQRSHEREQERLELEGDILRREREDVHHRLELAAARSEIAGVLTWVIEEAGSAVRPGDLLARIADLDSFRVEAAVSDAYAARLIVGQPVRVLIGKESLRGQLSIIRPTIEEGSLHFVVELETPSHASLRPNLRVDVLVVTGFRENVLMIPRGPYIKGGGDIHQVFVVQGDRAMRKEVRLGLIGHKHYELTEGLEEGDEVIVSDMRSWLHADQVRLK